MVCKSGQKLRSCHLLLAPVFEKNTWCIFSVVTRTFEVIDSDVLMRACGRHAPKYFQNCKKVGQKSAILQEKWSQYFP